MKKLTLGLTMLVAACSGGSDGGNPPAAPAADSPCASEGATACNANTLMTCVDAKWSARDCGALVCGAIGNLDGVFACKEPKNPTDTTGGGGSNPVDPPQTNIGFFEQCRPGTDTCETGLTCQPGIGICATSCNTQATGSCGDQQTCFPVSQTDPTQGICFMQTAKRGEECLINGYDCAPGEGTCNQAGDQTFICELGCSNSQIGTQGSCPAQETCLPAPLLEPQTPAATCTTPGSVGTCNGAEGFSCFTVQTGNVCARRKGRCGVAVPLAGDLSETGIRTAVQNGHTCDDAAGRYCHVNSTSSNAASAECVAIAQDQQGNDISICVGACGMPNGTDADCGTGYNCKRPAPEQAFYYDVQRNGTNPVTCTQAQADADDHSMCNTSDGFKCVGPFSGNAFYCAAPSKVCVFNNNAPAQPPATEPI